MESALPSNLDLTIGRHLAFDHSLGGFVAHPHPFTQIGAA